MAISRLSARSPADPHRAATPLELFFDLVIVIAIASLTAAFHHAISAGHGAEKLPAFAFVFVAIWWVWMNFTWYASAFDNDDALHRVLTILIMFGATIFAAGTEHIFETLDFRYGLIGWIIMRLGMILLWLRVAVDVPGSRTMALRYALGYLVAQGLWIVLYLAFAGQDEMILGWGVAIFAVELLVPYFADPKGTLPWHRHHIIERYGLLNIIVLGEALLSISLTLGPLYVEGFDPALLRTAVAGTLIIFAMWWLYFMETEHLTKRDLSLALLWGYGHVFIFAAGAMLAAGLGAQMDLLTHHSKAALGVPSAYVNASIAVYLTMLWLVRDRLHDLGWRKPVLLVGGLVFAAMAFADVKPEISAIVLILVLALRIRPTLRNASANAPHKH